jgi:hypothetical protein
MDQLQVLEQHFDCVVILVRGKNKVADYLNAKLFIQLSDYPENRHEQQAGHLFSALVEIAFVAFY